MADLLEKLPLLTDIDLSGTAIKTAECLTNSKNTITKLNISHCEQVKQLSVNIEVAYRRITILFSYLAQKGEFLKS